MGYRRVVSQYALVRRGILFYRLLIHTKYVREELSLGNDMR